MPYTNWATGIPPTTGYSTAIKSDGTWVEIARSIPLRAVIKRDSIGNLILCTFTTDVIYPDILEWLELDELISLPYNSTENTDCKNILISKGISAAFIAYTLNTTDPQDIYWEENESTAIIIGDRSSEAINYNISPPPTLNAGPWSSDVGSEITVTGSRFVVGMGAVFEQAGIIYNYQLVLNNQIINSNTAKFPIPIELSAGAYTFWMQVGSLQSEHRVITITGTATAPKIISISPTKGYPSQKIILTGERFGSFPATNKIWIKDCVTGTEIKLIDNVQTINYNTAEFVFPYGYGKSKIYIETVNNLKSTDIIEFDVIPFISDTEPDLLHNNEIVLIKGNGFSSNGNNEIKLITNTATTICNELFHIYQYTPTSPKVAAVDVNINTGTITASINTGVFGSTDQNLFLYDIQINNNQTEYNLPSDEVPILWSRQGSALSHSATTTGGTLILEYNIRLHFGNGKYIANDTYLVVCNNSSSEILAFKLIDPPSTTSALLTVKTPSGTSNTFNVSLFPQSSALAFNETTLENNTGQPGDIIRLEGFGIPLENHKLFAKFDEVKADIFQITNNGVRISVPYNIILNRNSESQDNKCIICLSIYGFKNFSYLFYLKVPEITQIERYLSNGSGGFTSTGEIATGAIGFDVNPGDYLKITGNNFKYTLNENTRTVWWNDIRMTEVTGGPSNNTELFVVVPFVGAAGRIIVDVDGLRSDRGNILNATLLGLIEKEDYPYVDFSKDHVDYLAFTGAGDDTVPAGSLYFNYDVNQRDSILRYKDVFGEVFAVVLADEAELSRILSNINNIKEFAANFDIVETSSTLEDLEEFYPYVPEKTAGVNFVKFDPSKEILKDVGVLYFLDKEQEPDPMARMRYVDPNGEEFVVVRWTEGERDFKLKTLQELKDYIKNQTSAGCSTGDING